MILQDGTELAADLVLVGIGVNPATDFLDESFDLNADGSITVDEYMKVEENIYAAGDIARFKDWRTGAPIRIEHWRLAQQHGRIAARNMIEEGTAYRSIPLFWTNQFDLYFRYVGHVTEWDELIIRGDLSKKSFIGYYEQDGKILAAAGANKNKEMAAIAELMKMDKMPKPRKVREGINPVKQLKELQQ